MNVHIHTHVPRHVMYAYFIFSCRDLPSRFMYLFMYLTHTYTCTQVCHVCIFYIFLFMYLRYVQRSKRNVKGADNDFSVECVRICFRCYLVYARQHLLPSGKLERSLLLSSVHFFHHISKLFSLRSASMISCCHSLFHGSDLLRMLRSVSFQRLQLQLVDIFNIS